jgi:hypothetical protein
VGSWTVTTRNDLKPSVPPRGLAWLNDFDYASLPTTWGV